MLSCLDSLLLSSSSSQDLRMLIEGIERALGFCGDWKSKEECERCTQGDFYTRQSP